MIRNNTFLKKAETLKPELLVINQEFVGKNQVLTELEPAAFHQYELLKSAFDKRGLVDPAKLFLKIRRSI